LRDGFESLVFDTQRYSRDFDGAQHGEEEQVCAEYNGPLFLDHAIS